MLSINFRSRTINFRIYSHVRIYAVLIPVLSVSSRIISQSVCEFAKCPCTSDVGRRLNATAFLRYTSVYCRILRMSARFPIPSIPLLYLSRSFSYTHPRYRYLHFELSSLHPHMRFVRLSARVTPHQLLLSRVYKVARV